MYFVCNVDCLKIRDKSVCLRGCMCPDLNRQVEQVFDDGNLSTGGCRVKRSVSSFVFAADLCAFVYQQAHHIQVT